MWKIWYDDYSNFSSLDGTPQDAPRAGVEVIVQDDEQSGRWNQCMDDYYIWKGDRWLGVDQFGMYDYLLHNTGPCIVLFGRTVPNDAFRLILKKAEEDPEFPLRSAWHKGELRL